MLSDMNAQAALVIDSFEIGDEPAKKIIERNKNARMLRHAQETRDELTEINTRIEKTLLDYQGGEETHDGLEKLISGLPSEEEKQAVGIGMEFVDDITQLEVIISNPVAKRKYQQYVTIFVVGYENTCGNRLELLSQINDFFCHYEKDNIPDIEFPDFNIDHSGMSVRDTLEKAETIQQKLQDIGKEVSTVLHKLNPDRNKSNKKKLEKELTQTKEQMFAMTEKLLNTKEELERSNNKIADSYRNLEAKQLEIEKLKSLVETAKKKANETESLRQEIMEKIQHLQMSRQENDSLRLRLAHVEEKYSKMEHEQQENVTKHLDVVRNLENQNKILQDSIALTRKDLENFYEKQLSDLQHARQSDMETEKSKHRKVVMEMEDTIRKLKADIEKIEQEKIAAINDLLAKEASKEIENKKKSYNDSLNRVVNYEKELKAAKDQAKLLSDKLVEEEKKREQMKKEQVQVEKSAEELNTKQKQEKNPKNISHEIPPARQISSDPFTHRVDESETSSVDMLQSETSLIIDEKPAISHDKLLEELVELKSKLNLKVMLVSKLMNDQETVKQSLTEREKELTAMTELKEKMSDELKNTIVELEEMKLLYEDEINRVPVDTFPEQSFEEIGVKLSPAQTLESPVEEERPAIDLEAENQSWELSRQPSLISDRSSRPRTKLLRFHMEEQQSKENFEDFHKAMLKLGRKAVPLLHSNDLLMEKKEADRFETMLVEMAKDEEEEQVDNMAANSMKLIEMLDSIYEKLSTLAEDDLDTSVDMKATTEEICETSMTQDDSISMKSLDPSKERDKSAQISGLMRDNEVLRKKYREVQQEYKKFRKVSESKSRAQDCVLNDRDNQIEEMKSNIENLKMKLHVATQQDSLTKSEEFIFTRNDVEHNQQMLMKHCAHKRIPESTVEEISEKMNEYSCIPAKRLARLAKRYLHQRRMKDVEHLVKVLKKPDCDLERIIKQMQNYQACRLTKWKKDSNDMSTLRIELAHDLLDRLRDVEEQTGIFLIKPYITYGRKAESNPIKSSSNDHVTSNISSKTKKDEKTGRSLRINPDMFDHTPQANQLWNPSSSLQHMQPQPSFDRVPHTSRLLELDVNRAMYAENMVSTTILPSQANDKMDHQLNLISYMTVDRPVGDVTMEMSIGTKVNCTSDDDASVYTIKRPVSLPALKPRVSLVSEAVLVDHYRRSVSCYHTTNPSHCRKSTVAPEGLV